MKLNERPPRFSHNLSQGEKTTLFELVNDRDLVFKLVDGGGTLVIQDAHEYQSEIFFQLADINKYKKLKNDPTSSFQKETLTFLENAKQNGFIPKSEFDFLYCQHPVRPVLYTLPKIHKSIHNPQGRPSVWFLARVVFCCH